MENHLPLHLFTQVGTNILLVLLVAAVLIGASGIVNLFKPVDRLQSATGYLFVFLLIVFLAGFSWICWFHYQVYLLMPLELPSNLAEYLNRQLEMMIL